MTKIKFPTFDGEDNVVGYFTLFENLCRRSGLGENEKVAKLLSCLKGTA